MAENELPKSDSFAGVALRIISFVVLVIPAAYVSISHIVNAKHEQTLEHIKAMETISKERQSDISSHLYSLQQDVNKTIVISSSLDRRLERIETLFYKKETMARKRIHPSLTERDKCILEYTFYTTRYNLMYIQSLLISLENELMDHQAKPGYIKIETGIKNTPKSVEDANATYGKITIYEIDDYGQANHFVDVIDIALALCETKKQVSIKNKPLPQIIEPKTVKAYKNLYQHVRM